MAARRPRSSPHQDLCSRLGHSTVGDRPIEVTLQRAWYALSWGKRLRLAWSLATSRPQAADLAQLQAVPSDEAMSDVLQQLSAQYPEVRALHPHQVSILPGLSASCYMQSVAHFMLDITVPRTAEGFCSSPVC